MKFIIHKIFLYILTGLFLCTSFNINAQESETPPKKERKVFFGGGIQLSVGSNYTALGISPSAIYKISDEWAAGAGLGYLYAKNTYSDYTSHVFNTSLLTIYNPVKGLQLSANYEHYFVNQNYSVGGDTNYNYPSLFLGAGYQVGRYGSVGIRYDVLYDEDKSIYNSPLVPYVRIYF